MDSQSATPWPIHLEDVPPSMEDSIFWAYLDTSAKCSSVGQKKKTYIEGMTGMMYKTCEEAIQDRKDSHVGLCCWIIISAMKSFAKALNAVIFSIGNYWLIIVFGVCLLRVLLPTHQLRKHARKRGMRRQHVCSRWKLLHVSALKSLIWGVNHGPPLNKWELLRQMAFSLLHHA